MEQALKWRTYDEITLEIGKQLKEYCRRKNITQQKLSKMSGVTYATIRRFETTGNISFESFVKILMSLNREDKLFELLPLNEYRNIEEVLKYDK